MDRSAYALGLFILLAIIGVATWIAVELRWWRRGQQLISRDQFIGRMVNAGVVVWVLLMVAAGKFLLKWNDPRAEIIYWLGILVIVLLIAGFAVTDWRRVMAVREQKEKEMYRELVQSLKAGVADRSSDVGASEDSQPPA